MTRLLLRPKKIRDVFFYSPNQFSLSLYKIRIDFRYTRYSYLSHGVAKVKKYHGNVCEKYRISYNGCNCTIIYHSIKEEQIMKINDIIKNILSLQNAAVYQFINTSHFVIKLIWFLILNLLRRFIFSFVFFFYDARKIT